MAGLGGFNPAAFKFGNAKETTLEAIQKALAESKGTSLTDLEGTINWYENHAEARVLYDLYLAAERFSKQADPYTMSEHVLQRWEKIFNINPTRFDTLDSRRTKIALKFELIGKGTRHDVVFDYLTRTLGPIFKEIIYTDPINANSYCPGGGFIPFGPVIFDGNLLPNTVSPYYSTVGYIAILLEKPDTMSETEFYDKASKIYDELDNIIGAWITFDWIREGVNGPGFYLDEDNNLDNQAFN